MAGHIKVRAHQLADDEVMTDEALAGMVGQRVRAGLVKAAAVEDGWLVLSFETADPTPAET